MPKTWSRCVSSSVTMESRRVTFRSASCWTLVDLVHHPVGLEGSELVAAEGALHEFFQPVIHPHVGGGLGEILQPGAVLGDQVGVALGLIRGVLVEPLLERRPAGRD